jgi:hypothetical protein
MSKLVTSIVRDAFRFCDPIRKGGILLATQMLTATFGPTEPDVQRNITVVRPSWAGYSKYGKIEAKLKLGVRNLDMSSIGTRRASGG